MNKTCLNCNNEVAEKFCGQCGQPANTRRINFHFLWHDLQHGLLHMDKGVLFTAKELFTRPGHSIREFLSGKRVNHFKPFSLIIVLAGIYGFLSHYFHINILSNKVNVTGSGAEVELMRSRIMLVSDWITGHYSVLSFVQIPVFTIATFIAFRKQKYNFMEHLVINTFLGAQKLLIQLLAFPLFYAFKDSDALSSVARITDIIGYLYMYYSFYQLFNVFKPWKRIVHIILCMLLYFAMFAMLLFMLLKLFVV